MENDFDPLAFYNGVADIYDRDTLPEFLDPASPYHRGYSSLLASLKPRSILEIGCGTGKRIKALVSYYDSLGEALPKITATDPSPSMLSHVPEDVRSRVTLVNTSDISDWADGSFDLTMTSGVLCSVRNETAVSISRECLRLSQSFCAHVDTPKDGPHLNDLDFLSYFVQPGLDLVYWNTIYPYPIANEAEHQIIIKKSGATASLADSFPLRSDRAQYQESWQDLLQRRLSN